MSSRSPVPKGRAKAAKATARPSRAAATQDQGTTTARLELRQRPGLRDGRGEAVRRAARDLGLGDVGAVEVVDVFWLAGPALASDAGRTRVVELICDPILQLASWGEADGEGRHVEVARRPGVTDAVAESLLAAAERFGLPGLVDAATGTRYELAAAVPHAAAERLASGVLANAVVDRVAVDAALEPAFLQPTPSADALAVVPVRTLDDVGLLALSAVRRLSLDLAEMHAIARQFGAIGRDPTDLELEMLAQTWSEHCVHKTFGARVRQREQDVDGNVTFDAEIDSIFRTYIVAATRAADRGDRLRSVFVDNAGIVAFDEALDLALKVETHNHPSALDPFGGANTGIGGVVRDILGVSARPIANLDVLCFGPPDLDAAALPAGVLHPRRIADGVVAGIEDYGNKMGIPTVAGAVVYDAGYIANPLVFCGTLGVLPHGSHRSEAAPGQRIVVLGGRTGRDGLRGATFSSMAMGDETAAIASTSVQIGHPIHEKQVLEVLLRARDRELYAAVTDCGAGGLSSAVGEMASAIGAEIDLELVPLKVAGLAPWEIWLSEAQERMVFAVADADWPAFAAIATTHRCEATTIGRFRDDGRLLVRHRGVVVADLDGHFLHKGMPQRQLVGTWRAPPPQPLPPPPHASGRTATGSSSVAAGLLALLATPTIRSKEAIIRRFDHEVQGGTVVKPLLGAHGHAPSDAVALLPLDGLLGHTESRRGVAIAVGIQPRLGLVDPYAMAWAVVDEAVRNLVAIGADPDDVSLLDNFCWGSPDLPDRMGALVRCTRGCHDAAVDLGAPFISGKDSLHNEWTDADGTRRAIPGTLLVTAMATIPNVDQTVTMAAARPGDRIYVVGETGPGLGGSSWATLHGTLGDAAPTPARGALSRYRKLHAAIRNGLCRAVHDISDGGLVAALAEMSLACGAGLDADLRGQPGGDDLALDALCFGERPGRLVVAVRPAEAAAFEAAMEGEALRRIGSFRADDRVQLSDGEQPIAALRVAALEQAFCGHLRA